MPTTMPAMLNALSSRKNFLARISPLALLLAMPLSASAQQPQANPPSTKTNASTPLVSMELKGAPLRNAVETLFENAKAQYTIEDGIPDTPIRLNIRDQPLDTALNLLLQQGKGDTWRLTYTKEAGVYHVKMLPVYKNGFGGLGSGAPASWEQIQLTNIRPQEAQDRLKMYFPDLVMLTTGSGSPSLLVQGDRERVSALRLATNLMDVAPRNVVLKVEIVQVSSSGTLAAAGTRPPKTDPSRSALLATVLRTTSGQETTGEDKVMGTPAQSARLQLTATPTMLGDGSYELNTRWVVSLPLSTGKAGANGKGEGLVRLEKTLSNVSRIRSGGTTVIGGVVLSQYGLKGEILFFVTLTEVTDN
jgi:hypothetical protein